MQSDTQPIELLGTSQQDGGGSDSLVSGSTAEWLSPAFMILGISLATWVMVRMLIRRKARGPLTEGTPHERLESIRDQAKKRSQVEGFAADAHELVQRLASQLDVKAARVEQLIEDADERIRKLERMRRVDHSRSVAEVEQTHANGTDSVAHQVYELADQGEKPVEIAKHLNQHVGQVELILALRRG